MGRVGSPYSLGLSFKCHPQWLFISRYFLSKKIKMLNYIFLKNRNPRNLFFPRKKKILELDFKANTSELYSKGKRNIHFWRWSIHCGCTARCRPNSVVNCLSSMYVSKSLTELSITTYTNKRKIPLTALTALLHTANCTMNFSIRLLKSVLIILSCTSPHTWICYLPSREWRLSFTKHFSVKWK